MTNTKWVLLQFIIFFCDKQAQKSTFAHRHTEQSGWKLIPDFSLNKAWTRAVSELEPDCVTTTLVTGNPQIISGANSKPGLMSDFAGSVHSHRLALHYRGFGGKVVSSLTSNVHPPHSGSQITIQTWCREWFILHQHLPVFLRLGSACFCSVCPGYSIYPCLNICFKIFHFLCPLSRFSPCWDGAEVSGFWGVWQLLQFLSW